MREIGKITKRTVTINWRQTSVSLEYPFWNALKVIAKNRNVGVLSLCKWFTGPRRLKICPLPFGCRC